MRAEVPFLPSASKYPKPLRLLLDWQDGAALSTFFPTCRPAGRDGVVTTLARASNDACSGSDAGKSIFGHCSYHKLSKYSLLVEWFRVSGVFRPHP
jgi:hypothetical protein